MPPSSAVISTYLPCPTAHFVRSRQVSVLMNALASGPGDLDDPLDAHVPQGHALEERPVLLDRVGVVARQVHVVVDVVGAAARLERLLEERRAPVPRPEIEGRGLGRRGCREWHGHGRRTSPARRASRWVQGPGGRRNGRPIVGPGHPIAYRVPPDGPGGARYGTRVLERLAVLRGWARLGRSHRGARRGDARLGYPNRASIRPISPRMRPRPTLPGTEVLCKVRDLTTGADSHLATPFATVSPRQSSVTRSCQCGTWVSKPSARTFGSSATCASGSPWTRNTVRGKPGSPGRLPAANRPIQSSSSLSSAWAEKPAIERILQRTCADLAVELDRRSHPPGGVRRASPRPGSRRTGASRPGRR